MSTRDSAFSALALGVDVEELYILLAEGVQVMANGLPPGTYENAERKVERSRDALLRRGFPHAVVREFGQVVGVFRPSEPGAPTEAFVLETELAAERLGELMADLRDGQPPDDAKAFDVGVMVARLHLCLRIVLGAIDEVRRGIYQRELDRTVPILLTMLQAVASDPGLRTMDPAIREHLRRLQVTLERYDVSEDWRKQAMSRADAVFTAVGMTITGPRQMDESVDASDDEVAVLEALDGYRNTLLDIALKGDPATAERGQRLLIEDCRRTVGPDHPITIAVRGDLAMSVLYQQQGELALGLALDTSDDAEEWRGPRDAATAGAQCVTFTILMATRDFEEVSRYYLEKLHWLTLEDPTILDPDLAEVRDALLELIDDEMRS